MSRMSFDLMVFNPEAAPADHLAFMRWFNRQAQESDRRGCDDPSVARQNLHAWFMEVIQSFPPYTGPCKAHELPTDEALAADYAISEDAIYAAFAWSKAKDAYQAAFEQAARQGLGLFDASSGTEQVWLPQDGRMVLAHQKSKGPTGLKESLSRFLKPY